MKISSLAIALCLGTCLQAQPLRWSDVVTEAKLANPDLLQADEALRQAELSELSAKAQFLPHAGLNASVNRGGDFEPLNPSVGEPGDPGYGLGLSSSLNLFNGFSNLAAVRQASARRAAAEASRAETRASVAYSLRQAFSQLIFSEAQITLSDELAARAKENADMVALRYEVGDENKGSSLQAKYLASQARFDSERARRQLRSASLALSRILNRKADMGLRAEGSLVVPEAPAEPDFEKLIPQIPSVRRASSQLEQAEAAKLGAYAPFLPSLNASASLNRSDKVWAPQNGSWSAGLSLSFPFFNGFLDTLTLKQEGSAEITAKSSAEETHLQARLDLENAWQQLLDAVASVNLRSQSAEATLARSEIARARYAQGLMSFESWDQIETQLSNARRQELSGQLDAVLAKAAFDRAQGKDLEP